MITTVEGISIVTDDGHLRSPVVLKEKKNGKYDGALYALNREEMLTPFRNKKARLDHLRLHGLAVPDHDAKKQLVRQYVIGVFQCRAVFTYVSSDKTFWLAGGKLPTPERFRRISNEGKSREAKLMERLAVRAVYALGWDYGVVRLGKGVRGTSIVLDVICRPKLNPLMKKMFEAAFVSYVKQLNQLVPNESNLLLGVDPEIILVNKAGKLVFASDYFGRRGIVGCDAIWKGNDRTRKPILEIRPRPQKNPRNLLLELYRGMLLAAKKIGNPNVRWLAGALPHPGFPIGGHIHFSGFPLNSHILRVLDNYLTLPLVLVEDERGVKRRPKYGFLGDFRLKPHGGFEYRTPPSWLVSPTITKGVLSLAKVIARLYPYLSEYPLNSVAVQQAYYKGDKETIREIVPRLWNDLLQFAAYAEEATALNAYYQFIMSGQTWDERVDIRPKWRIPPFHHTAGRS